MVSKIDRESDIYGVSSAECRECRYVGPKMPTRFLFLDFKKNQQSFFQNTTTLKITYIIRNIYN